MALSVDLHHAAAGDRVEDALHPVQLLGLRFPAAEADDTLLQPVGADGRVKGYAYLCGVRPGPAAANLGLVNDVRAHADIFARNFEQVQ